MTEYIESADQWNPGPAVLFRHWNSSS